MNNNKEFHERKDRKKEHIDFFIKSKHKKDNFFKDIYLQHNALPELNLDEIDTKCVFLGKVIDYPIIINAITGGTVFSQEINQNLSKLAKKFNIPIAVGSQTIALYNENSRNSFKIVRDKIGEEGIVLANLSANTSLEEINIAIEMIKADGIQLHLNVAQELSMPEGDRKFRGTIKNIEKVINNINKPVIIKEVGFGISQVVAKRLYDIGVKYIDISGTGGTNFMEIEDMRNNQIDFSDLYSWGIPTALSLIQCMNVAKDLHIIASGGIKNSLEVVKALCVGAEVVGISGEILRYLLNDGYEGTFNYIKNLTYKIKVLMLLLGKTNVQQLKSVPYKIKGELKELL